MILQVVITNPCLFSIGLFNMDAALLQRVLFRDLYLKTYIINNKHAL